MSDVLLSLAPNVKKRMKDMGDGTHAEAFFSLGTSNITGKFRESFESYDPVNGDRWTETKGQGDLVFVDGNAVAASYLVISKDPLTAGNETIVELRGAQYFRMPTEIAFGAHMSQRTLGQEFAIEVVDIGTPLPDVPELEIAAISQAASLLTIDTTLDHGLSIGKSIGVKDCSDPRANYPSLVVSAVPTPRQINCTAGPGGTILSQTIANPAGAKGSIFFRERFGRANNGMSQIFENATATNASLYVRSESGDALPSGTVAGSHSTTVGGTTSTQLVNSAYTYAFAPTTEFRMLLQSDRIQWVDSGVDSVGQTTNRGARTQVCPDPDDIYKLRFRCTNNKALTVPVAQIVTATKNGTTTANIVTDRPHLLAVGDPVVQYGTRAQGASEFPNLLTATAVASIVSLTEYTIVQGANGTITSYGGYVAKVQGGNLMSALGANAVVAQNATLITLVDGTRQLVITGNNNWGGLTVGDLTELVGVRANLTGVSLGVDGAWKVANSNAAILTLVLPYVGQRAIPADFALTDCGGGVIKRTDLRVSFLRVFDYERLRVEALARPAGDSAGATPVVLQGGAASMTATLTSTTVSGTTAQDAAAPNPIAIGGRAANANQPAMSAAGDLVHTMHTMIGAVVEKPYAIPEAEWTASLALTTTTAVPIQTAAGAGLKRHITSFWAINTGAAAVDLIILDGATERKRYPLPINAPVPVSFPTGVLNTANTALNVNLSAAGTVRFNATGYTAP